MDLVTTLVRPAADRIRISTDLRIRSQQSWPMASAPGISLGQRVTGGSEVEFTHHAHPSPSIAD